jgi:CspA family cold shock protein
MHTAQLVRTIDDDCASSTRYSGSFLMERGPLVRIIRDRGFGFVQTQGGTEVFVHHSAFPRGVFDTLQEGQQLEFDIETDTRGRGERATNVRLADAY